MSAVAAFFKRSLFRCSSHLECFIHTECELEEEFVSLVACEIGILLCWTFSLNMEKNWVWTLRFSLHQLLGA